MTCECTFDPEAHVYRINGCVVPGVTSAIGDVVGGFRADEYYLTRGRANHACYAMLAEGRLGAYGPVCAGFVRAWRAWAADCCPQPVVGLIERQLYSLRYRYAGTLDLVAWLTLRDGKPARRMVIDYKGTIDPRNEYQLAAYALALEEIGQPCNLGLAVELREDGTYKLSKVYDLKRARAGWLAILSAHNIRREIGEAGNRRTANG